MEKKLPYYVAYPMPFSFDNERKDRMDFEYMKSMYPDMAKKILPYVEDESDRMEYEGSMMFDEYPDQLQLLLMSRRIMDKIKKEKVFSDEENEDWLKEMIRVILYQELYKRRSDHRRYNRRTYTGIQLP